jgi:hypothetical protein
MPVQVSPDVLEGITAVRDLGLTNMLDRNRVIEILRELEYTEAEKWVSENQKEYANGVFTGFEAKQGECS